MEQRLCPFSFNNPRKANHAYGWWVKIKRYWITLWLALTAAMAVALWVCLPLGHTRLRLVVPLVIFSSLLAFIGSLHLYSVRVRKKFSVLGNNIPVHWIYQTIYDVIARPQTLLRNIDLERMCRYGDIYLMFVGTRPLVVVTTSELAEKISKSYDIYYKSDPRDLNMPFFFDWVGNNNVVLSNGDTWQRLRKIVNPSLSSVHIFLPVFHRKSLLLSDGIRKEVEISNDEGGTEVKLRRWLKAMSLDAAGEALFGYNFNHLVEVSNPGIDAMDYVINEIFKPIRIAFPIMNSLPLPSTRRLRACMGLLDHLVVDMITFINQKKTNRPNTNVLEILIRGRQSDVLNNDELRNNIIAMVLASHETTQVSLGATLFYLAKYPLLQHKLREESKALFPNLDEEFSKFDASNKSNGNITFQKLHHFHSLDKFILESLRMYSPLAHQNPRTATKDTELGGYHIPAGTLVSMNIHAIHMNAKEWEEPGTFNPERFAKDQPHNEFGYLPFGGGPRVCSGRAFSLLEQKVVLCRIIREFSVKLPSENYQIPLLRGSFTGMPDSTFSLVFEKVRRLDSV